MQPTPQRLTQILFLLAALLALSVAEADVFKWYDDDVEIIDKDKLEAYCASQRRSLQTLQNTKRISVRQGDTIRELSEDEKQARIARIRKNLQTYCNEETQ